jgi:lipopolysaccharide assembly outer membrane protein LptD (OstA)
MEATFKMSERTPISRRFVRVLQPRTYARGRTATINFGAKSNRLHWLELDQDVLIKDRETSETEESLYPTQEKKAPLQRSTHTPLNYATAGRAEFDSESDKVTLKVFPQAYQDSDTLTGDWMILHRDNDMVEVLHGNAYSTGNE